MKYLFLLGDGMSDLPVPELNNKTPLQCANKPTIDYLASKAEVGMVNITPEGCKGGSDVGNLSALGYDPRVYLTGRAPLEAAALGIKMLEQDVALRCNLVCLSENELYEERIMLDYSSDEISTYEASQLIDALNNAFKSTLLEFFPGVSYRHCLILHNALVNMKLTPPHDITDKTIKDYLPKGDHNSLLLDLMKKSAAVLAEHPVNIERIKQGKKPANSIWLWGQGRRLELPAFKEKYGKSGAMVTAVDLLRGIANLAQMRVMHVEGATGNLKTNFVGKAQAVLTAFKEGNAFEKGVAFCYLHFEAPDECGHRHEVEGKVLAIEKIDGALKIVLDGLKAMDEQYCVLIMPDHPTPLSTGSHSSDPVPYLLYRSNAEVQSGVSCYCEEEAKKTGIVAQIGYELIERLLQ